MQQASCEALRRAHRAVMHNHEGPDGRVCDRRLYVARPRSFGSYTLWQRQRVGRTFNIALTALSPVRRGQQLPKGLSQPSHHGLNSSIPSSAKYSMPTPSHLHCGNRQGPHFQDFHFHILPRFKCSKLNCHHGIHHDVRRS